MYRRRFFYIFHKNTKNSLGKIVKDYSLVFEVSQRTQDILILNLIKAYFNVGNVYTDTKGISRYRLRVKNEINNNLIPHFNYYPLIGYKSLQYTIWLNLVNLLINNEKRTEDRDIEIEKLIQKFSNLK